ncbi:MAG: hypothetical protein WBM17_10945 [Anaerolineales bacterium]
MSEIEKLVEKFRSPKAGNGYKTCSLLRIARPKRVKLPALLPPLSVFRLLLRHGHIRSDVSWIPQEKRGKP